MQVRVDTLAKTGEVIGAAVGSGATSVGGVRFDLKDRDGAERQALRLAVRDARARADAAAAGAGVTIDRVIRVEEQRDMGEIIRPPAPMMMARGGEAAQAAVPLEAGEIETRSRVTLTVSIR